MLGKVPRIQIFNLIKSCLNLPKLAIGQYNHFICPNDCYTHVLSCVSNDGARNNIGVTPNKALLIVAKVSEELSILLEKVCNLIIGFVLINLENLLIFKKASLSDKDLKIIIHRIYH